MDCIAELKMSAEHTADCKSIPFNSEYFPSYYECKDELFAEVVRDKHYIYEVYYHFDGKPIHRDLFEHVLRTFHYLPLECDPCPGEKPRKQLIRKPRTSPAP